MEENKNTEIVDQKVLAEDVASKIKYETIRQFLVKPLDPVMVTKEFSKPVEKKEPTVDENGIEAVDYDEVETEVKEVESDYKRGVVIKIPFEYQKQMESDTYNAINIKVGDIVVYKAGMGRWFDLCKDTELLDVYSIIAIEK